MSLPATTTQHLQKNNDQQSLSSIKSMFSKCGSDRLGHDKRTLRREVSCHSKNDPRAVRNRRLSHHRSIHGISSISSPRFPLCRSAYTSLCTGLHVNLCSCQSSSTCTLHTTSLSRPAAASSHQLHRERHGSFTFPIDDSSRAQVQFS